MVSIRAAVGQVKSGAGQVIDADTVVGLCRLTGHRWRRRGQLQPATTLSLFITQILHGNVAINHLRHLAGMTCSASAYCQARMRLSLALIEAVMQTVGNDLVEASANVGRCCGHRIWHIDGSSFSMPDDPELQARFGQPGGQAKGCGFPVAKLMVLTDAATGLIARTMALPLRTHEMSQAVKMHGAMEPDDVLVADRGFCSFAHLALILQENLHAVFRVHQKTIVSFKRGRPHAGQSPKKCRAGLPTSKWLRSLGPTDQVVQWVKPKQRPKWCDAMTFASLPDVIVVRELRYQNIEPGFRTKEVTLVTTLLDGDLYPKQTLADLYRDRWEIEKRLKELKITLGMDVLHCHSVDGVLKELAVFTLVYNLVRKVCLEAAMIRGVPPDRVSFIDALRWLASPMSPVTLAQLIVNPLRHNRLEPRVRKRRPKQYPLMQKPRKKLRQAMQTKTVRT